MGTKRQISIGDELQAALRQLQAVRKWLEGRRKECAREKRFDPAIAKAIGENARATSTLSAESRQRDKHSKQLLDSMTPEEQDLLVYDYLNELPNDRRRALIARVVEANPDGSLLSA